MSENDPLSSPNKKMSADGKIIPNEDSLVDNQNYLVTDQFTPFFKEWKPLLEVEEKIMNVSQDHPFSVSLCLQYAKFIDPEDDLNVAKVYLAIKDQQRAYQKSIEIGVYMGRIFINDMYDFKAIDKDKFVEGVNIVLTVDPMRKGRRLTTLRAVSKAGETMRILQTTQYLSLDWNGGISTGAHFKSISIEGMQAKY